MATRSAADMLLRNSSDERGPGGGDLGRAAEEPVTVDAINPEAHAERVDAVAGSEFVDDRLRLQE